jgi:hypothetical protein
VVIMANQGAVCEATGEVFPQAIDVMTRLNAMRHLVDISYSEV